MANLFVAVSDSGRATPKILSSRFDLKYTELTIFYDRSLCIIREMCRRHKQLFWLPVVTIVMPFDFMVTFILSVLCCSIVALNIYSWYVKLNNIM